MKREYQLSRVIIAVLTAAISFLALINEDISVKIVGICLFSLITFLVSFPGTIVSKKMIQVGDKIGNAFLRMLYYLGILLLILIVAYVLWMIMYYWGEARVRAGEVGDSIGLAIIMVFLGVSMFVFLVTPYIQTIIVLIIRKIIKR